MKRDIPGKNFLQSSIMTLFAAVLATVVFVIDLKMPNGVAAGALYIMVILYSWVLPGKYSEILAAIICTILIMLGYILKDLDSQNNELAAINRIISFIIIWICTTLLALAKDSLKRLRDSYGNLETKVESRTVEVTKRMQELMVLKRAVNEIQDYSIILTDINGNIVDWNKGAERIHGYSGEEIIGKPLQVLDSNNHDKNNSGTDSLLVMASQSGSVYSEVKRIRKNGNTFWADVSITRIHDGLGETDGFSVVTRDLTAYKINQEEREKYSIKLEHKNRELEQFAYIASHDLQEPLRTVSNVAHLLSTKFTSKNDPTINKNLDFLNSATQRMQELIKGLLDYSRLGKNTKIEEVDCQELVTNVLSDLDSQVKETGANIEVSELPTVNAYPMELRLLFQNLISNALKFGKERDKINVMIDVISSKDHFEFKIKDNGIGIETNDLEKIFMIFKRLHAQNKYKGNGIGLAHCQKIVDLHEGKIWVESEPGKGSSFYFTIPK